MEKSVRSETTRPPHNNNNNNSSVAYLFNKSYIAWPAPLGGSSRLVCALKKILVHPWEKKRKKSFAGPEVSRHLGNPLAADGKIVTTFFLAHKVFFFATGPIKLVLSSTKLVSAGLLGSFRLSDAEGIQTVGGFSLSLSRVFILYSTQVLIRRARSTRLMLQLTDDQYRRPPTPRCTNISSLFMYVGPLSLAPIVFSYPSTDWLCAPFRRNRCPSFTPFQRPLLSLFDLVDSFCWDSMASASIVYSGAASALCKC